jgi:O-antigen/teichoic acid export membrane protein
MSLRRNFVWMLTSKAALVLAALVAWGLINRSLGPADRGVLAEMQTWAGLFMAVFGISIDTAIYHFANKAIYGDDDKSRFVTILVLSFFYALLAAAALILFVSLWPRQVSPQTVRFLIFLVLFLFFSMETTYLNVFFQSLGNIRFAALIGMSQAFVNVLIVCAGFVLKILDLRFAVIALVTVQAAALALLLANALRTGYFKGRFSKKLAGGVIAAGLKQHLATISTFVYTKINQLIVFKYCGESQAGIFAVSLTFATSLMIIPQTFQIVLYPRIIHFSDDYEMTVKSFRLGFYVWGSVVLALIVLAKPLLFLYGGKEYVGSAEIFRIMMIGSWFLPLSALFAPYYIKKGAFGLASLSAVVLGLFSIGMNYWLVPKAGTVGAATATAMTCVFGFCLVLVFFRYLSKKSPLGFLKPDFKNEWNSLKPFFRNIAKIWE